MPALNMLLARPTAWGFLDELNIDPSGLVRIHGWSQAADAALRPPRVLADDDEVGLLHRYRYGRADVPGEQPFTGFAFEYRLPQQIATLHIDFGDGFTIDAPQAMSFYRPDYEALFGLEQVAKREHIYGSGPPAQAIDPDVQRLMVLMRGRTLDFGCGAGLMVSALRQRGTEAFGIEIDRPAIREGLLPDAAPYITLYQGGPLPFEDDSFDCVTAFEVIEHIDDYHSALREIARLAPMAIFSVPDIGVLPLCHRHNVVPWHLLESTHFNFFTETSLKATLAPYYSRIEFGRVCPITINDTRYHVSLTAVCYR
ncbi:class I SAM-dependent methyltransferase [Chitinimonas lacunae]|uniref:Class I SAM-dependent methyltransferase n=1 Tax=Chitinimonas lacunae TaxID=1963018 RepID=A0ABV8MS48_9NEIS